MNKNWIITAFILYLIAIAMLGLLLLNRKSSTFSESATSAPKDIIRKSAPPPISKDYSLIVKNDIFHPLRGKTSSEGTQVAPQKTGHPGRFKFDLKGVFRSGDKFGALLAISGNAQGTKETLKKADGEVFFQGSEIAEGCILQKVESTSITILYNGEPVVVEMEKLKLPEMLSKNENKKDNKGK